MIYVQGNDVKVGNGTGPELIQEAAKGVYGVFLTLKENKPEGLSEHELMLFVLREVGKYLARLDGEIENIIMPAEAKDDSDDFMNKVFGDLLNGGHR